MNDKDYWKNKAELIHQYFEEHKVVTGNIQNEYKFRIINYLSSAALRCGDDNISVTDMCDNLYQALLTILSASVEFNCNLCDQYNIFDGEHISTIAIFMISHFADPDIQGISIPIELLNGLEAIHDQHSRKTFNEKVSTLIN